MIELKILRAPIDNETKGDNANNIEQMYGQQSEWYEPDFFLPWSGIPDHEYDEESK